MPAFHGNRTRPVLGLVLLVCCALWAATVLGGHAPPALAFSSPNSPLGTASSSPLDVVRAPLIANAAPDAAVQESAPSQEGGAWRVPVGVGIVILGLALVVGGLVYLLRH
jgi:hypothetical protein